MKIIFIIDYNFDYNIELVNYLFFKSDCYFIYHTNSREIINYNIEKYGKILFFKNFKSAKHLLNNIEPDLIISTELDTLNQVALRVGCYDKKIPFIFLDHGFKNHLELKKTNVNYLKGVKSRNSILSKIKNRLFYDRTILHFRHNEEMSSFLKKFKKTRLTNGINNARVSLNSKFLTADKTIIFSNENKLFYKKIFPSINQKDIEIVGYPAFDHLSQITKNKKRSLTNCVILIDQPFEIDDLYGWTTLKKYNFMLWLHKIIKDEGYELKIKPHPRGNEFWGKYRNNFEILDNDSFEKELLNTNTILGFNSTLLLFLASHINYDVLILDKYHPEKTNIENHLVKHKVANFFNGGIKNSLIDKNLHDVSTFTNRFLFKNDGRAKERIFNFIYNQN